MIWSFGEWGTLLLTARPPNNLTAELSKPQSPLFQTHEPGSRADHQMIQHVDIEKFAGSYDFAGHCHILYTYMENVVWESLTL